MLVIINPYSGTDKKSALKDKILRSIDHDRYAVKLVYSEYPGHATELSRKAAEECVDVVVAVGGDGTVHEVGGGLIGSETALGIIPSGSGNGLANHLKIPRNIEKAVQILNEGKCKAIDTITANEEPFLGVAGIGFDAYVAKKFAQASRRGLLSYGYLVTRHYPSFKVQDYSMTLDGKKLDRRAFVCSFANGSQYGNHFTISPNAQLDDGQMRVVFVKEAPCWRLPLLLWQLRNGTIDRSPYYESFSGQDLVMDQKGILAHLDGEARFYPDGLHLKVQPRSLKIIS